MELIFILEDQRNAIFYIEGTDIKLLGGLFNDSGRNGFEAFERQSL